MSNLTSKTKDNVPTDELKQEPNKKILKTLKEMKEIENGSSKNKGYHNMYKLLEDLKR